MKPTLLSLTQVVVALAVACGGRIDAESSPDGGRPGAEPPVSSTTKTGYATGSVTASGSGTSTGFVTSTSTGTLSSIRTTIATAVTSTGRTATTTGIVTRTATGTSTGISPAGGVGVDSTFWFTYSDRTVPNSAPPIFLPGAGGFLAPPEGTVFSSTTDVRGPSFYVNGVFGLQPYYEAMGGGETTWGAGFGLDFVPTVPGGRPLAVNACETDAGGPIFNTSTGVAIPFPFDALARGYTGISFYATSFLPQQALVNVRLDDASTSPWGGECNVCQNGGVCMAGGCPCSDSYMESVLFPTGSWVLFTLRWTDPTLRSANWSEQDLRPGGIDATTLFNLEFQFATSGGAPLPAFDVGVADVAWLTD